MGRFSANRGVVMRGGGKRYPLDQPLIESWECAYATRAAYERARVLMCSLASAEDRGYDLDPRDPVFDKIFERRAS